MIIVAGEGSVGVDFDLGFVEVAIFCEGAGGGSVAAVVEEEKLAQGDAGEAWLDVTLEEVFEGGLGGGSVRNFGEGERVVV